MLFTYLYHGMSKTYHGCFNDSELKCNIKWFQNNNKQPNQGKLSLRIIIFQWSGMLSDYTRIYVGQFSFKLVDIFFYKDHKNTKIFSPNEVL